MARVDLQYDVLDRSHEIPVVIDFWASWCGPCRVLGPILDELAAAADGRWELVKLSTEEQPDVAQMFEIQGIPAVKMFRDGQIVGEFVGALPKSQIEDWLSAHLPDPRTDQLAALLAELEEMPREARVRAVEAWITDHLDWTGGRVHVARALMIDAPERARALIEEFDVDADQTELAADITALADLMQAVDAIPDKLAPFFGGAREALRRDDLDGALEQLVDAAMRDRHFGDELARRAAVALFHQLGQDDERTRTYQRRLAMALNA